MHVLRSFSHVGGLEPQYKLGDWEEVVLLSVLMLLQHGRVCKRRPCLQSIGQEPASSK
jgi:hypothetical protein